MTAASPEIVAELAPTGTLRAGINTGNTLLVSGVDDAGVPFGVAPDMARAIAERLGVPSRLVPFGSAGRVGAAVDYSVWDIALIGAEPARADRIEFTAAYCEIGASYLVPAGSLIQAIEDVDRPGIRIAVLGGSAYDLWLTRHIVHAVLVRATSMVQSRELFVEQRLEVLAGLTLGLESARLPGVRLLSGRFTSVQQAVGVCRDRRAGATFLKAFVEEAKRGGLVASLIALHGAAGLSVAPPMSMQAPP